MSSSRYVVGLLGLLLLTSISSAYTVLGGAFYCGNSSMTGDQICADCTNALNNNTYNFTFLNESVSGATANCINDPNLIDFKTFDCNGHTISGTHAGSTFGIDIEGEFDVRIIGCEVSGFTYGYYIADNSDNITVFNATSYNNTNHGFYVLSSTNITVLNATSYNNTNTGYRLRFSDECELNGTTAYENVYGYYLDNSDHTDILDSNATNNSFRGYYIYQSIFADITDSIAANNGVGCNIQDDLSDYNSIDNLTVYGSSSQGIYINGGDNNSIWNSNVYDNNGSGIEIYLNADDNWIDESTVTSNGFGSNNYNGIYIHETCLRNNITQTNVSSNALDGIRIYQSSDDSLIYNVRSYYNNLSGINISEESDNTRIYNSPVWENNLHGIYVFNSDRTIIASYNILPSPFTVIYGNNATGIYLEQAGNTNIAGILRNLTVHSNKGGNGVMFDQTPNSNLTQVFVRNNSLNGVAFNGNSDFNRIWLCYVRNNTQHGIAVGSSADENDFISNYVYGNTWSGFGIDGKDNLFDDNDAFENSFHGFHIATNGDNNFTNNEIYNNTRNGVWIQDVDNNLFWNNTFYGNGKTAATHNIYMTAAADTNLFYNTEILTNKTGFETIRYIQQDATATSPNNFTNLTVCYNESIGCSAWNKVNLTSATLDLSNFIAHPYFISLDDSVGGGANQFNKSANLTIAVDSCSPMPGVIKRTGFPTTLADILNNGFTYSTTATCSNNVLSFPVTEFSGYAANVSLSECFYANNPNTVYNIAANLQGNKSDGICITINASNIMINCSGFSITGNTSVGTTYGIGTYVSSNLQNITIHGCTVGNYSWDIYMNQVVNATVYNNTVYNSSYGIDIGGGSTYSRIFNNTAYDNLLWGIRTRSNWTNVSDNILYNNSACALGTDPGGLNSNFLRIFNNLAYENNVGFCIYICHNSTVHNNTAYNNSDGMRSLASWDTVFTLNRLYNNSQYGLLFVTSSYGTVANTTIYDNYDGVFVFFSNFTNFTNNSIHGNDNFGFHILNSTGNNLFYNNLYNNGYDLYVNNSLAAPITLNMTASIFTNPTGSMDNYTNLSLSDSIGAGTAYSINWTAIPAALPTNFISFAQKFVNITAQAGAVVIDAISWHWTTGELPGYNENRFELWKHNGTWSNQSVTLNTGLHLINTSNLNPQSVYGILQNNNITTGCQVITSSGYYTMTANGVGAPNPIGAVPLATRACVIIHSSDVVFDCNGYNITNNGTTTAAGIAMNDTYNNITVRNCPSISNYSADFFSSGITYGGGGGPENSTFRNLTVHNNTYGFNIYLGFNNTFTDIEVYGASSGFFFSGNSLNNTIIDNVGHDNDVSFNFGSSDYNRIINNTAYSDNQDGFRTQSGADYNYFANNTAYSCTDDGFELRQSGHDNVFFNNTARNNQHGFNPRLGSYNNTLTNNTIHSNTQRGIFIDDANVTLFDNVLYNNPVDLYVTGGASGNRLNMTNSSFRPDDGSLNNYTLLSIHDEVDASASYTADWNPEPAAPPANYFSFRQKYVNITNVSGSTTLDLAVWAWLGSEVSGIYDDDKFEVWKHNGTWSYVTGQTLVEASNYIAVTNLNPASGYGILQNNITTCQVISSPGSYQLQDNAEGAPITVAGVVGITRACVVVASDDVDFSCNGYNITNNGTADAAAILINGSAGIDYTNVTVRDCPHVSEYETGAYIFRSREDRVRNITGYDMVGPIFRLYAADFNNVSNCTAYNSTTQALFRFENSDNNNFDDNILRNASTDGFSFSNSHSNNVTGNRVYGLTGGSHGVTCGSDNNIFRDNIIHDNDGYGVYLTQFANGNTLINNTIANHTAINGRGMYLQGGLTTLINNTFYNSRLADIDADGVGIGGFTYNMSRTTFTNPTGTLENYTVLTIYDSVAFNEEYRMNWSAQPAALQTGYLSFREKYVEIDNIAGGTLITSATWHWYDSEVTGFYNESRFELWQRNGTWTLINNTPDVTLNELSVTNLNPSSVYGILQNNITQYCMEITSSGVYSLSGNAEGAPYDASEVGDISLACVKIGASNVDFSCNGYNITNNGTADAAAVVVNGTVGTGYSNVTIRDCPSLNAYEKGAYLRYADDSVITNSTSHNNTETGFYVSGLSEDNRFIDNVAYNNSDYGFYLLTATNNTIMGATAYDHGSAGVRVDSSDNCTVMNSNVSNSRWGIQFISNSDYNNATNNSVRNATGVLASAAIYVYAGADNNTVCDNELYDSTRGIYFWRSQDNYVCGGTIYDNTDGIDVYAEALDSGAEIENVHLYNNTNDITISSDGTATFTINVTNATIDNPAGTFQNYTSVSVNDTGSANEEYSVTWNPQPAALTPGYFSFEQKYLNITNTVGTSSIGQVRFNWYTSEIAPPYDENRFELWKHNGTWGYVAGQTLDAGNNYIEILNLNPASTFGILQNNLSQCFIINSSGNYQLANAVQGAPFSIAGVTDISQACVIIASDDVDFSCNGFSITNNGTADASAVVINGSVAVDYSNVTIRDCPSISQYEFGVYIQSSTLDRVNNVTSFNNSGEGIRVRGSTYTNITGNVVYNNTNTGIVTRANGILNNHLIVTDNIAYNNTNGIVITLTENSTVTDNRVFNNTLGMVISASDYSSFENNLAYENLNHGFTSLLSTNNNFTNNSAYDNVGAGFYFGANESRYVNNTAYGNDQSGFYIQLAYTNTLIDNEAFNNSWHGFQIDNGIFNTFTYDVSYNNTISGFYIIGNYTNLTNVTAYNNSGGIGFNSASFNIVESPNLYLNDRAGRYEIYFDAGSDRNTVSNAYLWQTTNYLDQAGIAAFPNNLTNFSIAHNTTVGIINWPLLSVTDIQLDSTTVLPEPTFVSVDSASEPEANAPANVTIYTPLCPNPTIYSRAGFPQTRGDILANGSIYATTIHSCAANLVKFDVLGFSGYSTGNYSNLTIWDSNDTGSVIYTGTPATFYANYSNSTNGAPIDNTLGSCFVMYNDSAAVYAMTYNATSLLWEHSKAFSNPGNYTWNVTCNSTAGFDTLFAEDDIPVLLGCFYADTPGTYTMTNALTGNKTDRACITVNSSNVIIDCAGFTITGTEAPGSGTSGIYVDNVGSVELRNCYATAYDIGYYLEGAVNSEVHNNTAQGNFQDGFNATQSTNIDFYNNSVIDNGNAGFAILGDSINVTNNRIDEGTFASYGIFSISDATYGDNNIFSYNDVIQVNAGSAGIFATGTGNTISYNNVTGVPSTGIVCGDDPNVPIFTGTVLPCDSASITDNLVYGNFFGVMALNGDGVDIVDSDIFGNTQMNVLLLNSSGVLITTDEINTSAMGVGVVNSSDVLVHTNAIHTNPLGQVVLIGLLDNITVEENVDALQSYVGINSLMIPGAVSNITDLYLTYNYSDVNGMVHWPVLNIATAVNLDNTNFLLEQDFVSLNDTNATEMNTTADITLFTAACPVDVFRLAGFPQTRADIVENGTVYTPASITCAPGSAEFEVAGFSGYALNESVLPPPPPGGRGGGGPECTDAFIELETIQCPDNKLLFIVTDEDDNPIEGARVALVRETGGYWSDVRNTVSDGTVEFILSSNAEYSVTVDGGAVEDYCSDSLTIDYVLCPEEGCYDDDDCIDTEYCDFDIPYAIDMPPELLDFVILPGVCTPVDCDCGEVYDHRCHPYECCSNNDCEEGYVCENHTCVPRGCDSDSDCGADQYCENGECLQIPLGDCGYIANHTWYDYECCNDTDCPEGYICYEHECVLYWIETNETGFVGDMHKLIVHPEGQYTLDITDPDGRMLEITTDAEGRGSFQLETEGKYGIELIEEEVPVIMVDVDALKRPLPPPDDKPITIIDEFLKYFWWLLILLLLIIGYILFRRRKKKKYKVK